MEKNVTLGDSSYIHTSQDSYAEYSGLIYINFHNNPIKEDNIIP